MCMSFYYFEFIASIISREHLTAVLKHIQNIYVTYAHVDKSRRLLRVSHRHLTHLYTRTVVVASVAAAAVFNDVIWLHTDLEFTVCVCVGISCSLLALQIRINYIQSAGVAGADASAYSSSSTRNVTSLPPEWSDMFCASSSALVAGGQDVEVDGFGCGGRTTFGLGSEYTGGLTTGGCGVAVNEYGGGGYCR